MLFFGCYCIIGELLALWANYFLYRLSIWCDLDHIWRKIEKEHAPFWVTLLLYTREYGKCLITPTIVQQASEWTYDLVIGVPDNWVVHSTPSGCTISAQGDALSLLSRSTVVVS